MACVMMPWGMMAPRVTHHLLEELARVGEEGLDLHVRVDLRHGDVMVMSWGIMGVRQCLDGREILELQVRVDLLRHGMSCHGMAGPVMPCMMGVPPRRR